MPGLRVRAEAATTGRTGVEMEALTAATVAALTIYDMVKGVEKGVEIRHVRLVEDGRQVRRVAPAGRCRRGRAGPACRGTARRSRPGPGSRGATEAGRLRRARGGAGWPGRRARRAGRTGRAGHAIRHTRAGRRARRTGRRARDAVRATRAFVLTVSDGVAAGVREDGSGSALAARLTALGFAVERGIVADDVAAIQAIVEAAGRTPLVVTTGGTGLTPRDVTPQATRAILDYEIPGFGEAMRAHGRTKTPMAILSRAVVGVRGQT